MYTGKDRRQHPRYDAANMSVSITLRDEVSGEFFVEKVQPVDFNFSGIAVETNLDLDEKSKIFLDISEGKNRIFNLTAIICHVVTQGGKKRYGLQFDFSANEYMESEAVEQALTKIELSLKKKRKNLYRNVYRRIKSSYQ
jgi:hypothetical protein